MEKIPIKIWNRIDMLQAPIATQIQTGDPNTRRWVTILPRVPTVVRVPDHQYCIVDIWYDAELLRQYEPYGDEDLARTQVVRHYVNTEAELYAQLAAMQIDVTLFNAPWHVDNPAF